MEHKLNQSGAAAAACDTSLSNTLMPSNCLRRPLPVCFPTWTPTQPHLSQRCPSASSPLPVSITAGFLSHMSCFISGRPRVASVFLNRVESSATGVRCSRRRAAVALTLAASLHACCLDAPSFLQRFGWFSLGSPPVPVKSSRQYFLHPGCKRSRWKAI